MSWRFSHVQQLPQLVRHKPNCNRRMRQLAPRMQGAQLQLEIADGARALVQGVERHKPHQQQQAAAVQRQTAASSRVHAGRKGSVRMAGVQMLRRCIRQVGPWL